jgi:predicted hydrocarbon binding protein
MEHISKSGYFNSNNFARIFLESIQEITGIHGLNAILNYASLTELVNNLPPNNFERGFDFSDFSAINQALEDFYGIRGGRGLAFRIGRTTFADMLRDYGDLAGIGDSAFKVLPLQEKMKFGLEAMASLFSERSDQLSSLVEDEEVFRYQVKRCPVCWGRSAEKDPVCYYLAGLLKESLNWVSGGKEFSVHEDKCIAQGDDICEFVIPKQPEE